VSGPTALPQRPKKEGLRRKRDQSPAEGSLEGEPERSPVSSAPGVSSRPVHPSANTSREKSPGTQRLLFGRQRKKEQRLGAEERQSREKARACYNKGE